MISSAPGRTISKVRVPLLIPLDRNNCEAPATSEAYSANVVLFPASELTGGCMSAAPPGFSLFQREIGRH